MCVVSSLRARERLVLCVQSLLGLVAPFLHVFSCGGGIRKRDGSYDDTEKRVGRGEGNAC